jgi:hypothetical protein
MTTGRCSAPSPMAPHPPTPCFDDTDATSPNTGPNQPKNQEDHRPEPTSGDSSSRPRPRTRPRNTTASTANSPVSATPSTHPPSPATSPPSPPTRPGTGPPKQPTAGSPTSRGYPPSRTPVANTFAERWIRTLRRKLLDRTIIWNQRPQRTNVASIRQTHPMRRTHQQISKRRLTSHDRVSGTHKRISPFRPGNSTSHDETRRSADR